ncbi:hypothetical protein B0H14DRAFT_3871967 [Mycena olivaceomarginata]|nr:hypothetical protein B0H14DRAFT_3871967 [Mycena olivaceomarginata]
MSVNTPISTEEGKFYGLPAAGESKGEKKRLDERHEAWSQYFRGDLWLAVAEIAKMDPRRIIDLGCGSGACQIPGNMSFQLGDLTKELDLEPNSFDIVHARSVMCHVPNAIEAIQRAANLVKPGGLLLLLDVDISTMLTTGGSRVHNYISALIPLSQKRGADFEIGRKLQDMMTSLGRFQSVQCHKVSLPFNGKAQAQTPRLLVKFEVADQALKLRSKGKRCVALLLLLHPTLPGRPKFTRSEVVVGGEAFELYSRNIIECVRALFGDTDFAPYLFVVPERHYADQDKTIRLYHNTHTGKWWWSTQVKAILLRHNIPILLSSDMFGNKAAYPVYMTIGNIPKEIRRKPSRRAYILLAYLPTSRLNHTKNKAARRRTLANLFHTCLFFITAPLRDAGVTGIPIASGDGVLRRGHPIVACYIGDYPEQLLVTCVKTGWCPNGEVEHENLGDGDSTCPLRNLAKILDALDKLDEGGTVYAQACKDAGIKPVVHPFWQDLPYTNIFLSITSDVLHQLYQGIIEHLIEWLKEACGEAELDARCRRLPPNHNIRLFMKGISNLNRVTGRSMTRYDISRLLLGRNIDMKLPGGLSPVRLVQAVRGILDFVFSAQYPMHKTETLERLKDARMRFHQNKGIFHYVPNIKLFGTSDNYNAENTERLHIDLAKDAYRSTNRKDEFSQMTLWLERKEKIQRHDKFIEWKRSGCPPPPIVENLHPGIIYERKLTMPKHPTQKAVKFTTQETEYGAPFFHDALSRYIVQLTEPALTAAQIEREAPPKRAKTEGSPSGATQPQAKTKKLRKSRVLTKVYHSRGEYEPVGVSAPRLVHDEAFRTCKFIEHAPVFRCDFDLDVLKQRPKMCAAERDEMQATIDAMKDQPGRVTSCIVVDRKGRILITYFSKREMVFKNEEGEGEDGDGDENEEPPAPAKPLKRKYKRKAEATEKVLTMEEFLAKQAEFFLAKVKDIREFYEERIPGRGARVWHDGIPREISKRAHQGMQDFAADHQPHFQERDVRYATPDNSDAREPDESVPERCSVYHLVHSWLAQDSSVNDEIGPSADIASGTAAQSKAVVHYF